MKFLHSCKIYTILSSKLFNIQSDISRNILKILSSFHSSDNEYMYSLLEKNSVIILFVHEWVLNNVLFHQYWILIDTRLNALMLNRILIIINMYYPFIHLRYESLIIDGKFYKYVNASINRSFSWMFSDGTWNTLYFYENVATGVLHWERCTCRLLVWRKSQLFVCLHSINAEYDHIEIFIAELK